MARVLLFGRLADIAGWRDRDFDCTSVRQLTARLTQDDAELGAALAGPGVQVAVDQVLHRGDARLGSATEVAYLPPMSGG